MQRLTFDTTNDSALAVALTRNDIAHRSVQALLDDVDHVVTAIEPGQRAEAARAVLAHHEPAVDETLLSDEGRALQSAARRLLAAIADDEIRPDDLDRLTAPEPAPPQRSLPAGPTAAPVRVDTVTDHPPRSIGPRPTFRGLTCAAVTAALPAALTTAVTAAVAAVGFGVGSLLAQIL